MKGIKIFLCAFFVFSFASMLPCEEKFLSVSAGISTGIPLYGSDEVAQLKSSFDHDSRVIIGSLATLNLNPMEQCTFFAGADVLCDFSWKGGQHLNFLHTAFPVGVKVYPGLGGLNLGLAYTLGFRTDFIKTENDGRKTKTDAWGNGFRFYLEYNFAHTSSFSHLPSCGVFWNLMPRGENAYDNIFALYLTANL